MMIASLFNRFLSLAGSLAVHGPFLGSIGNHPEGAN
jgi:hypothetical protein